MKFAINPANTPLVVSGNLINPEWYRFLVQQRKQGDDITDSDVLTVGPAQETYPESRALAVAAGELTRTSDDTDVTLGLADSGVTADTYGDPTRLVVLAIDAKGRVTAASEVKLDVSDVDGLLDAEHGGTGNATYVIGDLLYASATDSLSRLAAPAIGNVLTSVAVGTAPIWDKLDLTNSVKNVLPEANGGTGTLTPGFTGTVSPITSATFVNGKCTAAS